MNIKTFIDRPVLSCVLSVFIVLLGTIGLSRLPMEQFPEIAPPTVRVSATYTGANAETLQRSVICTCISCRYTYGRRSYFRKLLHRKT